MEEINRAIFEEDLMEANRLLESGCEIDEVDSTGKTPLMQAVEQEDARFVELLLSYGAAIDKAGFNGWAPLHMAVDISIDGTIQSNGKPGTEPTSIIGILISNGANLELVTDDGFTPLGIAQRYKNKKISEYLRSAKP